MASDIWLRTILIVRKETRCRHMGYSFRLEPRVLLYAPSHRQDSTYHGLCYTSRGALAGTRNSSMGPPHEGSIRRLIAPWANALTTELHLAPLYACVYIYNHFSLIYNCLGLHLPFKKACYIMLYNTPPPLVTFRPTLPHTHTPVRNIWIAPWCHGLPIFADKICITLSMPRSKTILLFFIVK